LDGRLEPAAYDRQKLRIKANMLAFEEKLAVVEDAERGAEERARQIENLPTVLEQLRASARGGYTPEQKRRILEGMDTSVTVLPDGDYRVKFCFAADPRELHRRLLKTRFPFPEEKLPELTEEEVRTRAAALRVALEATPRRWNMRTNAGSCIAT
jgi:hypothetical protein